MPTVKNLAQEIKVPPHDLEAERAVLGAVLIKPEHIHSVVEKIGMNPDVFYDEKNRKIYNAMMSLLGASSPIDTLTVKAVLEERKEFDSVGGMDYLSELVESVEVIAHVQEYAEIVKDKFLLRKLIESSSDIINLCLKEKKPAREIFDEAEQKIMKVTYERTSMRDFVDLSYLGKKVLSEIGNPKRGGILKFGYGALDNLTFGLHPGELVIIAARPSVGKTTFGINVCMNIARQLAKDAENGETPRAVCVFSLEMSSGELFRRMLASESHIKMNRLRYETLDQCIGSKDMDKINDAITRMALYPICIDATSSPTVLEMKAKARRIQIERGLALVLIDYLQLMPGKSGKMEYRQFEIADISRNLKLMAKELGVPVIAISQLSRDVEKRTGRSKKPRLSDLRDSGAIEQDADLVIFLHRQETIDEDKRNPVIEVIIGKQRNGSLGTINLKFMQEFSEFVEMEKTFGEESL
ncbi:MAG: replicative DNA helicase [Elusimicrobia bacterium]|nr:replicative DNA helicase [Elusimicrobiota bacterium]